MSNILVINSGSTSVKYKLFDRREKQLQEGCFNNPSLASFLNREMKIIGDYERIIKNILREIKDWQEVEMIGHRVVHGGDRFIKATLVDNKILAELQKFNHLAPLHNPYNLAGIEASLKFLPNIPQVAVFDTAFYFNLPPVANNYALPESIVKKYNFKRFGFHGLSHHYVMQEAASQLKKDVQKINLITCHLGGGWSATAIKGGQAVDTSMGWTPLEGLVMMTRAGDLDPGIIIELFKNSNGDTAQEKYEYINNLLNRESGIKGLTGGITNYRELLKEVSLGDGNAKFVFDLAIYRLSKYIGAYWTVLKGEVDAIIFTGAIGAGDPMTRNAVMSKLKCLGDIDVLAIKSNEELMIVREVKKVISE